jgi:hypothetical protein
MTTPENISPPPPAYPPQQGYGQAAPPSYGYAGQPMPASPAAYAPPSGPLGQVRSTGLTMLLFFVTLGIWGLVYYYQAQEEMKRHSGQGIGGVVALVVAIFAGVVSPFLLSHEVGGLYERQGQPPPVNAMTGLWFFPGILILVGPFIWFVKTNEALNDYWRGFGVR